MPEVEYDEAGGFSFEPAKQKEPESPSFFTQTIPAAFRLENDVLNLFQFARRQREFTPTPGFNPGERLREIDAKDRSALWETHGRTFVGVRSEEEFQSVLGRIRQEEADQQTLSRAGVGGFLASITAGMMSPTIALPFIGNAKGLAAVRNAAAFGFAGGLAQEVPLQLNQETRGGEEAVYSIGASTVVSAMLGGAVSVLSKAERKLLEENLVRDVDTYISPGKGAIPGAVGADVSKQTAGGIAEGVPEIIKMTSPVLRTIDDQTLPTASWTMAQFSDGGLQLAGNKSGAVSAGGGNLESLIKTYDALYVQNVAHIDNAYAEYFYGVGKNDVAFRDVRATVGGFFSNSHMTKEEFRREVSLALWSEDKHTNPFVQKAAENLRRDYFIPMLAKAQDVGLISKNIDLKGDVSYLLRDYDVQAIRANPNEFIDIIAANYERQMIEEFQQKVAKLAEREGNTKTLIEDLQRPAAEVDAMQESFKRQLRDLEKGRLGFIREAEDTINSLRHEARLARRMGDDTTANALIAEARRLEESAGPMLKETRADRKTIKQRLRNLNKAQVVLERKQAAKLDKIDRLEEMNLDNLESAVRRGRKMLDQLDGITPDEFAKQVKKFENLFADVGERYDQTIETIARLAGDDQNNQLYKLLELEGRQEKLGEKLTKITRDLENAEDMLNAVPVFREIVEGQLQELIAKINGTNNKRAVRTQRLREQAAKLDPAQVTRRIDDLRMADKARRQEFLEAMHGRGADNVDLKKGTADFKAYARDIAVEIKDKVIGTYLRAPAVDLIRAERGVELARAINVSSKDIQKFLNTNIDQLLKKSVQTLAPDIEIMRRFGTINFEDIIRPIADEWNMKLEQFRDRVAAAQERLKDPTILPQERAKLEKLVSEQNVTKTEKALSDTYFDRKRDIEAVYERLRGTWGIPDDPEAIGYRLGKVALNLNVLRLMGGTVITSIGDMARPVFKHGLTRVLGDGFGLMVNDLKAFKMSMREARLAGAGLDPITHSRTRMLSDLMTDHATTSRFERSIEFASTKMGIVAMFDYWTAAMKQFSGVVANARFLDSVDLVINGKGTQREIQDAVTFLASHNIGRVEAEKIWKEMQEGGASLVKGTWLPNTEVWKNKDMQQLFRAAVVKNVDDTIITPGVELPIVMNKTIGNRLLFQFKSFGMSSTYKTVGAGLQQRDMAVFQGIMVSLAFGALSYYTYAILAGGKAEETMRNADAAKWADEAIQRSGVLGIFGDGQRIAERLPYVGKYSTASGLFGDGERLNRNASNNLIETLLGPTFGFGKNLADVLAGLEDPTQSTLQKARQLAPYQNLVGFRRMLDLVVENSGLPERRD